MEQLDVFDASYAPLAPSVATIDTVHARGLWHQTFACWIVNPHRRSVLLQQRGPRNRIDAGSFDASASGHLAAGETPAQGFREVHEELGLTIPESNRIYLGFFRNTAVRGSYINNEFCHVFLATGEASPHTLSLQQGEVSGVFETQLDDLTRLFARKTSAITIHGIQRDLQGYVPTRKDIALADMCNWQSRSSADGYYPQVCKAIADVLNNHEPSFFCGSENAHEHSR